MKDKSNLSLEELIRKFPAASVYLIEIFIIKRDYGIVKNSVIARRLGVTKPAVTQAMNRLKKYNLIMQDLYGDIKFTATGREFASTLLRRHYLLEHLLVKKLDYHWEKSDDEASRLQSAISEEFADYLFEILGKPQTCPHGNPMPNSTVEKEILAASRLIDAAKGESLSVVRITEEGEAAEGLLHFCYENQIKPGSELEVKSTDKVTGIQAALSEYSTLIIPPEFARFICCTQISHD